MAYTGLTKSLQAEWLFLQRVTPNIDMAFAPIKKAISKHFLLALLEEAPVNIALIHKLTALSVRLGSLEIPDPTTTANHTFDTSEKSTALLVTSLFNWSHFNAAAHTAWANTSHNEA
jgi:hypothetical protein